MELAADEDAQSVVTSLECRARRQRRCDRSSVRSPSAYKLAGGGEVADLAVASGGVGARRGIEERVPVPHLAGRSVAAAETVPAISFEGEAAPAYHGPALLGDASGAPRVVIPVFPGNNCEYDSAAAFERAGAVPTVYVVNNLTPEAVAEIHRRAGAVSSARPRSS